MTPGEGVREAMQGGHSGSREDTVTKTIESGTATIPSIAFLGLALGSMALSLAFMAAGRRDTANFIGQWAPTILIMGLYNKLVKQHGSDRDDSDG
jgi:hypothetical protein